MSVMPNLTSNLTTRAHPNTGQLGANTTGSDPCPGPICAAGAKTPNVFPPQAFHAPSFCCMEQSTSANQAHQANFSKPTRYAEQIQTHNCFLYVSFVPASAQSWPRHWASARAAGCERRLRGLCEDLGFGDLPARLPRRSEGEESNIWL